MRLITRASWIEKPWKNGGGTMADLIASPDGAGLGAFDWRLSTAKVERPGPFSVFPEIDRTMLVLSGTLELQIEGTGTAFLTPRSNPFDFPGDAKTYGAPINGNVEDLNLMIKRDAFAQITLRRALAVGKSWASREVRPSRTTHIVFVQSGTIEAHAEGALETAGPHDCVVADSPISVVAKSDADVIGIVVWPVEQTSAYD